VGKGLLEAPHMRVVVACLQDIVAADARLTR